MKQISNRRFSYFFVISFFLCLFFSFFYYIDQPMHWVYDPTVLHETARKGISRATASYGPNPPADVVVHEVIQAVLERYPKTTRYTGNWFWNNAGGAMGSMTVLHCSFSEYLIIFGTPLGTEGHSGRHLADDFFHIIYGEQWAAKSGVSPREVYKAGDQHFLPRMEAKQYRMDDECWALEYARGNIPSMMIFGFLDGLFSTVDFLTLGRTIKESAGSMLISVLNGKI